VELNPVLAEADIVLGGDFSGDAAQLLLLPGAYCEKNWRECWPMSSGMDVRHEATKSCKSSRISGCWRI
jgi:hypothetical protein